MEMRNLMYLNVSPYREVLEGMELALQINDGIIKLTGRDGTGKTALCRELCQLLAAKDLRVLCFPVAPDNVDALQAEILAQLGLEAGPNFTKQLSRYLQEQPAGRQQLHVIFDDAQDIGEPVFDSIRMLCNIQDARRALVKPIICGSPALEAKLARINFRSVTQYLSQGFTLAPMTTEQIKDFYWAY
jgi:type II secretory pathway predicted ATPase ExeA